MEKKINRKINEIVIQKNVLNLLNETVEKYVVNSRIIIFVDFLTIKLHQSLIHEIKACGLNNAQIEIVLPNDKPEKFENKINETLSFVVCIGENWLLKFGQSFAIKNNINYGFVNLFALKTEIFAQKTPNFAYFPPCFCLIEKNVLTLQEKFSMFCNIFKYSYFVLESEFDYENKALKTFASEYLKTLNNLVLSFQSKQQVDETNQQFRGNDWQFNETNRCFAKTNNLNKTKQKINENSQQNNKNLMPNNSENLNKNFDEILYESVIKISLMLERFNLAFSLCCDGSEFSQFSKNFGLAICYKNAFSCLNEKNLWLSRVKFLSGKMVENYDKIDVKFHKFFLLNFKEKFKKSVQNFMILNQKLLNFLKENFFKIYYNHSKFISQNFCEIDFNQTFLQKMSFFEIFNQILNAKCLKV